MTRYDLLDECRVLLVHGLLHLLGYDHEIGVEEAMAMAAAERHILDTFGWKVRQIVGAVESQLTQLACLSAENICKKI